MARPQVQFKFGSLDARQCCVTAQAQAVWPFVRRAASSQVTIYISLYLEVCGRSKPKQSGGANVSKEIWQMIDAISSSSPADCVAALLDDHFKASDEMSFAQVLGTVDTSNAVQRKLQQILHWFPDDPYLLLKRRALTQQEHKPTFEKARVKVQAAHREYAVLDESGTLREGEIYYCRSGGRPVSGQVLLTREPCDHIGDVRKVRAVGHCEQLSHLKDCIVVSQHGSVPLMWTMGGGDLDGDKLLMICCAELVELCEPRPPFDHGSCSLTCWTSEHCPGLTARGSSCVLDFNSLQGQFWKFSSGNELGRLSILRFKCAHLYGADSPEASKLAALCCQALDCRKTGVPIECPRGPRFSRADKARVPFTQDLEDYIKGAPAKPDGRLISQMAEQMMEWKRDSNESSIPAQHVSRKMDSDLELSGSTARELLHRESHQLLKEFKRELSRASEGDAGGLIQKWERRFEEERPAGCSGDDWRLDKARAWYTAAYTAADDKAPSLGFGWVPYQYLVQVKQRATGQPIVVFSTGIKCNIRA